MKMNKEEFNMSQKFRDLLQNHEVKPDPVIWQNIAKQIHPGISVMGKRFSYGKIAISSILILSLAISLYYISNNNSTKVYTTLTKQNGLVEANNTNPASSTDYSNQKTDENKNQILVSDAEPKSENNQIVTTALESENTKKVTEELNKNQPIVANNQTQYSTAENEKKSAQKNIISYSKSEDNYKSGTTTNENSGNFNVVFGPDQTICFGEEAILEVKEGDYSIYWENGSTSSKIRVKPMMDNEYKVVVTNKSGETKTHIFKVTIDKECTAIFIPTAFTPNGDGNNDVLMAQGVGIQDFKIQIMNRAGTVVYESEDMSQSWDGMNINQSSSSEVFIYIIKYTDAHNNKRVLKGQVTLIK